MRVFNRIVAWIFSLASLYVSTLFILMWIDSGIRERFMENFAGIEPYKLAMAGFVLLLLGTAWLVFAIENHYRTRSISFNGPGGLVKVQLTAIENFLSTEVLRQVKAVKRIRTVSVSTQKGLRVIGQVVVLSNFDIRTTVNNIQDLMRRLLQDNIGVERIAEIRILVHHISGGDGEPADRQAEAEAEREALAEDAGIT